MKYDTKTLNDPSGNIEYGCLANEEIFPFLHNVHIKTPFVLEYTGITYPDTDYYIERKRADYYVMEYIVSGEGYLVNNNKEYTLKAGDVYFLKPGSKHRYGADKNNPYKKLWANFFNGTLNNSVIDALLFSYGLENECVIHCPKSRIFFEELIRISETSKFNDEIALDASLIIFKIITELAQTLYRRKTHPALAEELKIHLDASLHDNVSIENLASGFHVSKTHLINEFKKCYNETPYNYLLNRKIETAKILLKFSSLRINEIASNLKFNDGHHFSNVFKKKTGFSPLEFREKQTPLT